MFTESLGSLVESSPVHTGSGRGRQARAAPAARDATAWWSHCRHQAMAQAAREPLLRRLLEQTVLSHEAPAQTMAAVLARRLGAGCPDAALQALLLEALNNDHYVLQSVEADLVAVTTRDPACRSSLHALLHFKGFQALQAHRVAHSLWRQGRPDAAHWLSAQVALALAVDIHPAVPIGQGVMLDHATGIVIGETALIEDDVSILHGVTLGATGKQRGDRHPKVRRGALLGAGSTVLGNIEVGCMSTVGAGSVVVKAVPPHATVAGVPAKPVRSRRCD
jgi:serine O-acetyltransferase